MRWCSCPAKSRSTRPVTCWSAARRGLGRAAALFARLTGPRAGEDLRGARPATRGARDQRGRNVADDSRRAVRRGCGTRARQPLQRTGEVPAPADRAGLAGERRPAQGALRARRRGHLHPACMRRTDYVGATAVHRPGDPAHQPRQPDPADGCARARHARGLPVPRRARRAPAQRRLPIAAGTGRRRRRPADHAPRAPDGGAAGRPAARADPGRGGPHGLPARGAGDRVVSQHPGSARAAGRRHWRRPTSGTRCLPTSVRISSEC